MARKTAQAGRPSRPVGFYVAVLLVATVFLTLFGIVMIYSASTVEALVNESGSPWAKMRNQAIFALIGFGLLFGFWKAVPASFWNDDSPGPRMLLYGGWAVLLGLNILVRIIGNDALGAYRWINIGPFSLQPSEFMKIAIVVMAARCMARYQNGAISGGTCALGLALFAGAPLAVIVGAQSDLGTTIICVVTVVALTIIGGAPWWAVGLLVAVMLAAVVAMIFITPYRMQRIMLFMDPWNDGEGGQGSGRQLIHARYALALGGLFGVGLGNSVEKYLYLPEPETDFIFAIVGEELGLVGALAVVAAFVAILWAGVHIAFAATDNFSMLLALGCTIMLVFQACLNICCVIGIAPVTGKPLPFLSAGGSSLISSLLLVGRIQSVAPQAELPTEAERRRSELRVVRSQGGRGRR